MIVAPKLKSMSQEQKDKLIDLAFEYHREHGFPYPNQRNYELWADFFDLCNTDMKIVTQYEPLFDYTPKFLEVRSAGLRAATFFHPHIWDSHAINMRAPMVSYKDNVLLKRAIEIAIEIDGRMEDLYVRNKLGLVRGSQRCSNFRPTSAKAIYQTYLQRDAKLVLDPSAGYGGRLLGFLSLQLPGVRYVGVDPSQLTCKGNQKLAKFFDRQNDVEMLESPFEDVNLGEQVFDFAFTSPPYFKKEIYSEEQTQSCHRYPEYSNWLKHFWRVVFDKVHRHLREDGGLFIVNINDVKIRSKVYPLIQDTLRIAEDAGFYLKDRVEMIFPMLGKNLVKRKTEAVLVFEKIAGDF